MRKMARFFGGCFLVAVCCFPGCSRKEINLPYIDRLPDTIYPTAYLPAWPGSWWRYDAPNGDSIVDSTGSRYFPDKLEIKDTFEIVRVPLYDGSPLWGNWLRIPSGGEREFIRFVTDSFPPGTTWHGGGSPSSGGWVSEFTVMARDTILTIGDTTYKRVVKLLISGGRTNPKTPQWMYYFAKDVGIVRKERLTDSTTFDLTSFFINW